MNKKNVLSSAGGGGGAPLNRIYYGRDFTLSNNYWCSCRDNIAKFDGQY